MRIDKKSLVFFILGALLAISIEQLMWWNLLISKSEMHNDFWIIISEDIKSFQEGSKLKAIYSTDIGQAGLILNIWKILFVISIVILLILILRKG